MQLQLHFKELNASKAFGTKQQASQMFLLLRFFAIFTQRKEAGAPKIYPF